MNDSRKTTFLIVFPIALAVLCLTGIFLLAAFGVKYNPAGRGNKFTQDFYYSETTVTRNGAAREKYVTIQGITPLAAEREALLIPSQIDGCAVKKTGYSRGCSSYENAVKSDKLKKLYLPQLDLDGSLFYDCPNLNKVIFYNYTQSYLPSVQRGLLDNLSSQSLIKVYVSSYFAESLQNNDKLRSEIRIANLSYMYNFDGAANYGYYFIDDVEAGDTVNFVPPAPERNGYEFGGWFRESSCINEWNFKNDRQEELPPQAFDLKLYAKWIKKQ